jgi:hypothetical protein
VEELDSALVVGVGVEAAGVVFVDSDDADGLEDSDEEESGVELGDGDAVALAPRLSFL